MIEKLKETWSRVRSYISARWKAATKFIVSILLSAGIVLGIVSLPYGNVIEATPQSTKWFDDIRTTGDVTVGGRVGIGDYYGTPWTPWDTALIRANQTYTFTGGTYPTIGNWITQQIHSTSDVDPVIMGALYGIDLYGTSDYLREIEGVSSEIYVRSSVDIPWISMFSIEFAANPNPDPVAATIGTIYGVRTEYIDVEDSTAENVYTLHAAPGIVDTGHIGTTAALYVDQQTIGAGDIDEQYGILIDSLDNGDENYSIYTNDGTVWFGDRVVVQGDDFATPECGAASIDCAFTMDSYATTTDQSPGGMHALVYWAPSGDSTEDAYPVRIEGYLGGSGDIDDWYGVSSQYQLLMANDVDRFNSFTGGAYAFPTYAGTIASASIYDYESANGGDMAIAAAHGIKVPMWSIAGGSITDSYGEYIDAGTIGAGSVDDQFGLYIENITGADSNNYSIYTNGGAHHFGDDVSITGLLNIESTSVTIDLAGAVTVTSSNVTVDTNGGAASDNLDTINGGTAGDTLIVRATNDAHTVVARDTIGNLQLSGNCTLDDTDDTLMLMYDGSNWLQLACNDNS